MTGAVSGASVDPARRATILRQGLTEAAGVFAAATFDRIEVEARLSPFEIVGRAKSSASFAMPDPEAFAPGAGLAVNLAGQGPFVQASRAFWKSWPFPGGNPKTAIETMRDSGQGALLAGFPHLLAMLPAIESRRAADAPAFDWTRFDRVGTLLGERTEAEFVSLMPAGTKRAAAECAFAPKTPCDRKAKLKLGSVVKLGALRAALYEIGTGKDKRFVVVSSDGDSQKLEAPTLAEAAGMQLDVETGALAGALPAGALPAKITGQMSSEGGMIVFRVK